ncbi:BREX-2 system adenine-specific DNA-methyltransferase PglX [Corallococcus exiguus]|uniref:BREX-2 system adenine-specific DNA-methyltransferase PglX n=1 Tax=Corallococcus exiguus TaxID=83462 RepID=UPI00155F95C1|nr:BREX-2 system adenine-specific DNA-methyltransferase PglX [Corallococcus exiguus]NRD45234.1 BREX-2 system adenine-specific DNA-methyltransferase PglX [Corallococcus exiguus]
MKANDRARLTTALRDHVAKIAADLRAKMRAPGAARAAAEQLHKDERVAEDFEVWTDLLSRRAAVLWVLKSVYVRVLEDRGLLAPGRLLDPEAQQLFEKLAPNLGETAFLRWIYKDLASTRGGVPELFSPQPAEVALPSDDLSRALIAFWRHRDADTGAVWSFAEERFEGELMGDLYQELDPVVKDRFALCQTPDFVRTFILDRTLTPAIETFSADEVRLLDPACGSGHFLIDGLKRLVAATAEKHKDWPKERVVAHALDRVVGTDLNDYACALARTRLIMTAAELAGVTKLTDAARFHPHVYWADGLEQVEKEEQKPSLQFSLFEMVEDKPRATLTRSDVRAALKKVFEKSFHAVVANPPYILERDEARKAYHRELVGKNRRYVSATGKYSLGSPFTERCFQLAEKDGFVGLITSNNFMKREFGRALIEKVLAGLDLTLVADTSQAYIPFHGTPTVLLFGRNRRWKDDTIRAVMGKRGEVGTPDDPANGKVWSSIAAGWDQQDFENEYVSVANLPRDTLSKHPWSLGGGGASDLKQLLESRADGRLVQITDAMGITAVTGEDDVYVLPAEVAARRRVGRTRALVIGEGLRDWSLSVAGQVVFPYDDEFNVLPAERASSEITYLKPYYPKTRHRRRFGTPMLERGLTAYELQEVYPEKLRTPLTITFAEVATHNHFVLDRGGKLFKQTAPVIKLPASAQDSDYLALLGLLNSSVSCFWMKQVFHKKAHASQRHHPDPARAAYQFGSTGMQAFPVPDFGTRRECVITLARLTDECARHRSALLDCAAIEDLVASSKTARALEDKMTARWGEADTLRERMVALQEEIDWVVYVAFGLAEPNCLVNPKRYQDLTCPRGSRPFERKAGRTSTVRAGGRALALNEGEAPPVGTLPDWVEDTWHCREGATAASLELQMLETPVFKRAWRDTEQNIAEPEYRRRKDASDLEGWFAERVERQAAARTSAFSLGQLVASLQDDPCVLVVAEVLAGRRDFSIDALVAQIFANESVPQHRFHVYTDAGLAKRAAWEEAWALQRREEAGEKSDAIPVPPEYSQGSRGKSTDFIRTEYWRLRGKLDVPKERFIAFSEVPGRAGVETLYGWAGWPAQQRVKAILAIDEELEDASVPLADRIGLLDSAWRLLPDVAREDAAAATRLKAELQALVGPEGPSREFIEEWKKRFLPPTARAAKGRKAAVARKVDESEEDDE